MDQMATDIGSRLRQARELRGLTLGDISATTKISIMALGAIERNDFDRLPGGVFRGGYIRAFAAEVGLDADGLVREYRTRFETELPAAPPPPREDDWKNRLRLPQRLPAVLVTIVGLGIGGSVLLERGQALHDGSEGPDVPGAMEVDIPGDTVQPDDSESAAEAAFATAAVTDIRAPSLRLEIRTTGLCWVSAVADGERTVYRLMQPGERTLIEARTGIVLRVGDAGAFAYLINGAPGRPLGRTGEAVTVLISDETLGSLSAEPTSAMPAKGAATRIPAGSVGRAVQADGQRAGNSLMIHLSHGSLASSQWGPVSLVSP